MKGAFDQLVNSFKGAIQCFPDKRIGKNWTYSMEDAALGAFSVFFTQCPSFLAYQRGMQEAEGKSNAQTLFGIKEIPTDNHIRSLLDPVSPEIMYPVFDTAFNLLNKKGHIDKFRAIKGDLIIILDATWYFSSKKIHCDSCLTKKHRDGTITYYHSAITPVIAKPGCNKVIPLPPEFILPQDGHTKQDCENMAAKRWIRKYANKYSRLGVTILGDDLYSRQPICKILLIKGFNFILVCKEESHKYLYEWVALLEEGVDRHTFNFKRWNGKIWEVYTYRYANDVPLRDIDDALRVNWIELKISTEEGKLIYKNAFITNHTIKENNAKNIVLCGRTRWKIENENNNTLKTKGYYLEHNYGHGKKNLSFLLATFIILAFLFHTMLEIMDKKYQLIRKTLPTRKTFFNDLRAITRYICFDDWEHLMNFMMKGLKLKLDTG